VGTVRKALDILDLFSGSRPTIGLSEAARLVGRDKATTLRYLNSLESKGFIEQDPHSRSYHLGPALVRLAMIREATYPVNKAAQNILKKLVADTGETAHLSHHGADSLSQIAIEETSVRGTRVYMDPAEPLTFHATASGIAYLSQCPEAKVAALLALPLIRHTNSTITSPEAVLELLKAARDQGYAMTIGTFEDDICGIAAPVFGPTGAVCGAVGVATPMSRITPAVQQDIAAHVIQAAHLVSAHYGATCLPKSEEAK